MTITLNDLLSIGTPEEYTDEFLNIAKALGLNISSWQTGSVARTMIECISNVLSTRDTLDAQLAAAGYLDTAADPNVSAEPVTGIVYDGSWLDILAANIYDVYRIPATYGSGLVKFTNSTSNTYSYAIGTFHIDISGSLYTNTELLSIAPGITNDISFQADVIGVAGCVPVGTQPISVTLISPIIGVSAVTASSFVALDYETNTALVLRCKNKLNALSSGGSSGAYAYWAQTIPAENPAKVFSGSRSTPEKPVNRVNVTSTYDGYVNVVVANATGEYDNLNVTSGQISKNISAIIASTPDGYIQITTATGHGLETGSKVYITGVTGTIEANNTVTNPEWTVTKLNSFNFYLNDSLFIHTYTGGGTTFNCTDLDLIKKNLEAYCVPISVRVDVTSAIPQPIAVYYQVYVDAAYVTGITTTIDANIKAYINSLPIGGGSGVINYLPYDAVLGIIFKSSTHIRQATLTLQGNSTPINVAFTGSNYVMTNGSYTNSVIAV